MDEEAQAVLLELDELLTRFQAALVKAGGLVEAGKLDGNQLLVKFSEFSQVMMGGGVPG